MTMDRGICTDINTPKPMSTGDSPAGRSKAMIGRQWSACLITVIATGEARLARCETRLSAGRCHLGDKLITLFQTLARPDSEMLAMGGSEWKNSCRPDWAPSDARRCAQSLVSACSCLKQQRLIDQAESALLWAPSVRHATRGR